jgi:hypothetical protein
MWQDAPHLGSRIHMRSQGDGTRFSRRILPVLPHGVIDLTQLAQTRLRTAFSTSWGCDSHVPSPICGMVTPLFS